MSNRLKKFGLARQEWKLLYDSFVKFWFLFALTVLFSFMAAAFEGIGIGLLIPFLKNLSDASSHTFHTGWYLIDHVLLGEGRPQLERMYRICAFILVATWLRAWFGYLSEIYALESRTRFVEDLRLRVVDQLHAVALRFFSKTRSGEIISSLTLEMGRVIQAFQVLNTYVSRGALLIVYLAFMIWVSWQLSLIVLVFFVVLTLTLTRLIKRIRRGGEKITRANGRFTSTFTEFISGIRTVVAFNAQAFERERIKQDIDRLAKAMIRNGWQRLKVQPLSQAVVGTVLIAVIVLAVQFLVIPGELDIALLLAFLFALLRLMPVLHELNKQRGQWASLRGSLSNITDLLRREDKPYMPDGSREVGAFREALTFERVSFSYEPEQPVLKDINLRIECGKTTAIVGASGAGKSTLVDLIPRFYDPTEGRVLLDGVDLRAFRVASLRQKIAVVSQDTFIFNDTVSANIAYGLRDVSMDRILEAAEKSNALEFIRDMPEGMDTVLGDRGVRLSGGQRQRLAIARALLRDPEILILDEATSALDSVSERLVQQSLELLMKGRTVVAIAHRLSTVENADWVIVLEEGRVVEQGTYAELLRHRGQLWEYHALQFQLT